MIKALEIIGLVAIGGTIYAFVGMIGSDLRWPVFGVCTAVAVAVIMYRKRLREKMV